MLETLIDQDKKTRQYNAICEVYRNAKVIRNGDTLTTINELTDQVPAVRPETIQAACDLLLTMTSHQATKLLTEEDKCISIAAIFALKVGLPMAVARWYPYSLPNEVTHAIDCEYYRGQLYMNGIEPGDRVCIFEDTISTGGTLVSLINAVRKAGAEVVEILSLMEKVGNGGVARVQRETGLTVKTLLKINVHEHGVEVV